MRYRTASYLALALLVALSAGYIWLASDLSDARSRSPIGPGYFPLALGVLLIILCGISAVQTARRTGRDPITVPNLGTVILGLAATAAFLAAWRWWDAFYATVFVFSVILIAAFAPRRGVREMALALGLAAVLTLAIWALFGQVMQVRF